MKHDPTLKRSSRQLRKARTPAESRLWHELRNRRFAGHKFRRQHAIGPFIADFYCADAGLVVELDGESHLGHEAYDRDRQDWLESRGLKVLRFFNNDIPANLDEMLECIFRECRERSPLANPGPLTPGPSPREGRGEEEEPRSGSMLRARGPLTPGPSPREGRGEEEHASLRDGRGRA